MTKRALKRQASEIVFVDAIRTYLSIIYVLRLLQLFHYLIPL